MSKSELTGKEYTFDEALAMQIVSSKNRAESLDDLADKLVDGGFEIVNRFDNLNMLLVTGTTEAVQAWLGDGYDVQPNGRVDAI